MAAAHQTPIELVLQQRISPERLAPYIRETPTLHEAIRLYRWNIDLSGAVYEALHVFEVVLRNALDEQLCIWNTSQMDPDTGQSHSSTGSSTRAPCYSASPAATSLTPDVVHSNRPHADHRANETPSTQTSLPRCPSEPGASSCPGATTPANNASGTKHSTKHFHTYAEHHANSNGQLRASTTSGTG